MSVNEKVLGLDLGTGNSCVAVIEGGKATVVANAEGTRTTPSVIFIKDGEREVGGSAKRKMTVNPKNTVNNIKRFMGADWNNADVQKMLSRVSYDVVNEGGKPRVKIDGKVYTPEEISSYTVAKMKKTAEDYYGCEVKKAVITVPAWFDDAQRQATKIAGELAGLEVMRVINEPTAAILAANITVAEGDEKIIAVTDIGQGTTDISVCSLSMIDGQLVVEVLASYGSVFLGGENYDTAIVNWLADEYKKEHTGVDLRKDPIAHTRLIEAAEKAKCELSSSTQTEINLPYITVEDGVPTHLVTKLTRAKFESLTVDITDEVIDCTRKAFEKAKKTASEIDSILLVGGSTRMPAIQDALSKTFNLQLDKSVNPDEAVALGAAIQADILGGDSTSQDILLLDVTPLTLGIEVEGGIVQPMIEANTTIPCKKSDTFTTAVDNQTAVTIRVYQGERKFAHDCKLLGEFNLGGILPARRGEPKIEVSFDMDASGLLKVTAVDKATNKESNVTITASGNLSKDEIERIKSEAEAHRAEDEKRKAEVDKLNQAESFAYQMKKITEDAETKDKLTEDQCKTVNEKADAVIAAVQEKNLEKAEAAQKELEEYFQPIAQQLYAQAGAQQTCDNCDGENCNCGNKTADDTVEDVSFEEVK